MGSGKTTSFDIAHRAGVSQATVSRALRDSPLVNPQTRERIKAIARELNYQVDRNAASLRSQQSRTIALLLFEDPTTDDSQINPFFLSMLGNITRAAAANRYDLLVSFQQLSEDWHHEYEVSNRADGIILLGYGDYTRFESKARALIDAKAHFVIWGPVTRDLRGYAVGCDNAAGGHAATRHLLGLGRRRIAFLGTGGRNYPEFRERHRGYCRALDEAGIEVDPALRRDAVTQEAAGAGAVESLLAAGEDFDAVFAASDLIAIGAMKALRSAGRRVPEDVAVVGFDDIPAASYFNPSLTTMHQDTAKAGERLVENLLRMIEGEPGESGLIRPELVVRRSCGAAED